MQIYARKCAITEISELLARAADRIVIPRDLLHANSANISRCHRLGAGKI